MISFTIVRDDGRPGISSEECGTSNNVLQQIARDIRNMYTLGSCPHRPARKKRSCAA